MRLRLRDTLVPVLAATSERTHAESLLGELGSEPAHKGFINVGPRQTSSP